MLFSMGISIFLNLFCLIKHAKVILGVTLSEMTYCEATPELSCKDFYILNDFFSPCNVNYEYMNTKHRCIPILMVKCLCWMFVLFSFKQNWKILCSEVDLTTNPVCCPMEIL